MACAAAQPGMASHGAATHGVASRAVAARHVAARAAAVRAAATRAAATRVAVARAAATRVAAARAAPARVAAPRVAPARVAAAHAAAAPVAAAHVAGARIAAPPAGAAATPASRVAAMPAHRRRSRPAHRARRPPASRAPRVARARPAPAQAWAAGAAPNRCRAPAGARGAPASSRPSSSASRWPCAILRSVACGVANTNGRAPRRRPPAKPARPRGVTRPDHQCDLAVAWAMRRAEDIVTASRPHVQGVWALLLTLCRTDFAGGLRPGRALVELRRPVNCTVHPCGVRGKGLGRPGHCRASSITTGGGRGVTCAPHRDRPSP